MTQLPIAQSFLCPFSFSKSRRQSCSPWMEDIVDSGIGLSNRSASLCGLADRYRIITNCQSQLYPPSQGLWIWLLRIYFRTIALYLANTSTCRRKSFKDGILEKSYNLQGWEVHQTVKSLKPCSLFHSDFQSPNNRLKKLSPVWALSPKFPFFFNLCLKEILIKGN